MQHRLFQPLRIGPREMRNRILFGSHTTNFARQNLPGEQHTAYYTVRAEGGAGLIVLEELIVHPSDLPYECALAGYSPALPAALRPVCKSIQAHGALVLAQLNHNGQQSSSDHHQHELWAPSAVPDVASREVPKVMESEDIRAVIEGFALTARHARAGQADGIELQVSDRSLLRQFLSPLTNQRSDAYGGELANRLRFLQETLEAVDAELGPEMILGLRFCADELAPWAGLTPEQGIEIARLLCETGRVDYLTITQGSIFSTQMFPFQASMHIPQGYAVPLAASIKAAVEIPVFAAGRIMSIEQAEQIIADGQADGVEMIRPLIAEPWLARLAQDEESERARPCLACNQGCQVRGLMNEQLGCNVNPDVIRRPEWSNSLSKRTSEGPFVIVGGGPAGLEAALIAARRGKPVILYEREPGLGGAVALAAKGPGRSELARIIEYLQAEVKRLAIEVRTGIEVSAEQVLEHRPSAVLVATGARPGSGLLPIPGHDLPHVLTTRAILRGERPESGRILLLDETASHGTLSVALLLAAEGREVEIVTEDWYIGRDLVATHDIVSWMQQALALGITLTPHTSIKRIEPGQVIVNDRFIAGERALQAETVVLGVYERPEQELYFALKGHVPRLYRAGDCIAPRRIAQAIMEGRHVGEYV